LGTPHSGRGYSSGISGSEDELSCQWADSGQDVSQRFLRACLHSTIDVALMDGWPSSAESFDAQARPPERRADFPL
jgi:hypothetical protein